MSNAKNIVMATEYVTPNSLDELSMSQNTTITGGTNMSDTNGMKVKTFSFFIIIYFNGL